MFKITKSVTIQAPVAQVFDYMADPHHYLDIWPNMVEVSHVEQRPEGGHSFDWVYKMAGIRFKGHAQTVEAERNKRVVTKNDKGIPSTFRWTYGAEDGGTKVTVEVDYELPGKILGKIAGPLLEKTNQRDADTLLRNLKSKMEGRPPVTTGAAARPPEAHPHH